MSATLRMSFSVILLGLSIACRPAEPPPVAVSIDGCVTAADGRFILTELIPTAPAGEPAPGAPPQPVTEAYLLMGADDRLADLVGQRVHAVGEPGPPEVLEFREAVPPQPPAPADPAAPVDPDAAPALPEGEEPMVEVYQDVRLEVQHLRLQSVQPTGEACEAGDRGSGAR